MDLMLLELTNRTPDGFDSYFVWTRGQRAFAELFWGMTDAEWDQRVRDVAAVTDLLYSNRDGAVYRLTDPDRAAAR
jgi:hypothetical protein